MINKSFLPPAVIGLSCLIIAAMVFYAGSIWGPGLTYDSINYLYAGYSLSEKGEILRPFQTPFIEWPPLYPVIIAALTYIPGSLLRNIFFFQIIIAALTVGLSCILALKLIRHRLLQIVACLSLAFSTPLLLINHFVWSESFFVLLTVFFAFALLQYAQSPALFTWFILALLGMVMCLQRYVGVFFIVSGMGVVVRFSQNRSFLSAFLYGAVSVIPLCAWWFRNYLSAGRIWNDTSTSDAPLLAFFSEFNSVLTSWFLPDELNSWLRLILILCLGILIIKNIIRWRQDISFLNKPSRYVLMTLFISYYVLAFASCYLSSEPVDDRILAPAYIPGMLLFFSLIDTSVMHLPERTRRWIMYACLLWTIYPVSRALYNAYVWRHTPRQESSEQPVEKEFTDKLSF